jgi:hypothetical protein
MGASIDIAYSLTAGGPLGLSGAGRRVTVPVADELVERRLDRGYTDASTTRITRNA